MKPNDTMKEDGFDLNALLGSEFAGADLSTMEGMEELFMKRFPSLYNLKYKPIRRKPLTFKSDKVPQKHRPWQQAILDDLHPNKVVEKSRQLGLSELAISEFIWFLDVHRDTKGMYTFPRDRQMQDFSKTRITPALKESPYLSSLVPKSSSDNSIALKKIGSSYLFMRSAWGGALGEGADLDILGFDEYDRMKENVELAFQESLKSSKYGWLRRWSTPTIPGRGINKLINKSDQKRYFWTCEHCGEKQFLTFEDNVQQVKSKGVNMVTQEIEDGTFIIGCKKCKKELNRWGEGEWVAQSPIIQDISGYHISQMDAIWISADDIMRRQFNYPSRQLFHNYVIGQPFSSEGMIINDQDVEESVRLPGEVMSRTNKYQYIVAGIDWGKLNWMIITGVTKEGRPEVLSAYWFQDNPYKPLEPVGHMAAVLKAYNPDLIVADAGYGADRNAYLFTHFPNAMFSCQFTTVKDAKARVKFLDAWNEKTREITVDKTSKMQRMLHLIKARQVGFFAGNEKLEMIKKHLKNVRIMDEEDGGTIYQVATRIGDDHLACCMCYAVIGIDRLTEMGLKQTKTFGFDFV